MIYYFGFYQSEHSKDFYPNGSINAISFKMGYVAKKIRECGEPVHIISSYVSDKPGLRPYRRVKVDSLHTESFLPTLRVKGVLSKITGLFRIAAAWIGTFLLIKPRSTVVVYHSPAFSRLVSFLKKTKKLKIILEVEEVFYINDKQKDPEKIRKREERLFRLADAYIVVNDLIFDKYLQKDKKHIVVYGSYASIPQPAHREETDKIRILFSGSLDRVRGAETAVALAAHLSDPYEIHICGSGAPDFVRELEEKIRLSNEDASHCPIVYHGQLPSDELDELVFSCRIGLNLQDTENPFEAVSFPSKITFYLLHGLNVVSSNMTSVLHSKLKECVTFSKTDPESLSETITHMKLCAPEKNVGFLRGLDEALKEEVQWLLK